MQFRWGLARNLHQLWGYNQFDALFSLDKEEFFYLISDKYYRIAG
jgi:hypothetical protein